MARFQVGEAFLQVIPSVRNIHRSIAKQIKEEGTPEITVDIKPNMKNFHKELADEVDRIDGIEIPVRPDMKNFHKEVRAGLSNLGDKEVTIRPDVDTTRANAQVGAFATAMRAKLQAAITSIGDIRMDADSTPAERKIASLRAQLVTLQNQKIGVDIDATAARAKIRQIQAELTALSNRSANIQVKVDTARAVAELAALSAAMKGVEADSDRVGRSLGNTNGALGRTHGAARLLLAPLAQVGGAFGGVVRSLGGLVSAGASAASSFQSVASGGAGLAGAMASLAPSLAQVGGSFATLGGALLTAVPLLAVVGGSAATAVAGVAQLGGAVLALGSGIVPLTGLLGTLPGLIAPIGIAVGALAIAFGDAGLKKEVTALGDAFKPLVNDIRNQLRPALTELLQSVAQLAPTIQAAAPVITSAISDVVRGFSDIFKTSTFRADLTSILTAAGADIRGFGTAAQSVFKGLIDTMIAAQPAVHALVGLVQELAAKFAAAAAAGRASGDWAAFFQQGVDVLRQVLTVVGNVAGAFRDLWDSANRTGAFQATLSAINDGITRFREYISQAGGSWDQLLAKAGPITASIINLIASIGTAFTEIGANVDIVPLLDSISSAITSITPAMVSLGAGIQKLGPLFSAVGAVILDVISGIAIAAEVAGAAVDTVVSVATAAWQALTGNFAESAKTLSDLSARTDASAERVKALTGFFGEAGTAATGMGTAIGGIPTAHDTKITADATAALGSIEAAQTGIKAVPQTWLTRFAGDILGIGASVLTAQGAVKSVPQNWGTAFTGDSAGVTAAANAATAGIYGVITSHLTAFTGDASSTLAAANAATGGILGVITSHATAFTGDNGNVLGAASGATGAINSVPTSHASTLTAVDNASRVAQLVTAAMNLIPRSVTTVITAIQQTVAGKAAGGILAPMAQGGILPMAPGGRLTPMSGARAQIVPPNTWRVIGDRMRGLESFIPINNSKVSQAILARTAELMGRAVIPERWLPLLRMFAPILGLARGRILATDDSGAALGYATDPDLPGSVTGARRSRPRSRPRPQPDIFRLIEHLFRRLVMPALSGQSSQLQQAGQTMATAWQAQSAQILASLNAAGLGPQGYPQGPPSWRRGGSRNGVGATAGQAATGALPPGYDRVYSGDMAASPRPDPPWLHHRGGESSGRKGSVFNIYPRADQSEEAIAMMVDRRQAFSLRT